eukprot:5316676-Amphidinium_carterae.1
MPLSRLVEFCLQGWGHQKPTLGLIGNASSGFVCSSCAQADGSRGNGQKRIFKRKPKAEK